MSEIKRGGGPPSKPSAQSGRLGNDVRDFDRGFKTKHIVKGAAGGARGVDYQDHEAEYKDRIAKPANQALTATAGTTAGGEQDHRGEDRTAPTAEIAKQNSGINLEQIADVASHNLSQSLAHQRITNPLNIRDDERKKKKLQQPGEEESSSEEESASTESGEADVLALPDDEAHQQTILDSIARILKDPGAERKVFGALALTNPEQMRKSLSTPSRVAKHLLVLAARLIERGQERPAVVEYMANTFITLGPEFGKRALKDFAGGIGIGVVYPLEVIEKVIAIDEKFLPIMKCRFTLSKRWLKGKVKDTMIVEYPEELIITSFAIKGGGKPGYQLVPMKEKGKHGLRMFQPGEYQLLIAGVDPMGFERLEEIKVSVEGTVELTKPTSTTQAPPRPRLANPRFRFTKPTSE